MPDILIFFDLFNDNFKKELIDIISKESGDSANVFGRTDMYEQRKPNQSVANAINYKFTRTLKTVR